MPIWLIEKLTRIYRRSMSDGFAPVGVMFALGVVGLLAFATILAVQVTQQEQSTQSDASTTTCATYTTNSTCEAVAGCDWKTAASYNIDCGKIAQGACSGGLCTWRDKSACQLYECSSGINGCTLYTPEVNSGCSSFTSATACSPSGCSWQWDNCSLDNCMAGCNYQAEVWEDKDCTMTVCAAYSTCSYDTEPAKCSGPYYCTGLSQTDCNSKSSMGCGWSSASTTCEGTYRVKTKDASCTGQVNKRCEGTYVSADAKCEKPALCIPTAGRCEGTPATPTPTRIPTPTPRPATPTPTPGQNCSYPSQVCSKPNQVVACTTTTGQTGTKLCTMTRCSSSSPYSCSTTPTNCTSCVASTVTPTQGASCSAPAQSCNLPNQKVACSLNGQAGVKTCTLTRCSSTSPFLCSQTPINCGACVVFEANLSSCYENCRAAGNTVTECKGFPSCGVINQSCVGQPNNARCQRADGLGYCFKGRCEADKPNGGTCTHGNQCEFGLMCLGSYCRQLNLDNGRGCSFGVQCKSKLCLKNICRGVNLQNGEVCQSNSQCNSGICGVTTSGQRVCQNQIISKTRTSIGGEFCGKKKVQLAPNTAEVEITFVCDTTKGYSCKNSMCRKSLSNGSACTSFADCSSGRCDRVNRTSSKCVANPSGELIPGYLTAGYSVAQAQAVYSLYDGAINKCIQTRGWSAAQCTGHYAQLAGQVGSQVNMFQDAEDRDCVLAYKMNDDARSVDRLVDECRDERHTTYKQAGVVMFAPVAIVSAPYAVGATGEIWSLTSALAGGGMWSRMLSLPTAIRAYVSNNPIANASVTGINATNKAIEYWECIGEAASGVQDGSFCSREYPNIDTSTVLQFIRR